MPGKWNLCPSGSGEQNGKQIEGYYGTYCQSGCMLLGFGLAQNLLLLSPFLFVPVGMGMYILCLSYHCILEAYNIFDFNSSHLEENLPQDKPYSMPHPYLT